MSDNQLGMQPQDRRGHDKTSSQAFWGAAANLPAVDAILESCRALDEKSEPINRDTMRALWRHIHQSTCRRYRPL